MNLIFKYKWLIDIIAHEQKTVILFELCSTTCPSTTTSPFMKHLRTFRNLEMFHQPLPETDERNTQPKDKNRDLRGQTGASRDEGTTLTLCYNVQ